VVALATRCTEIRILDLKSNQRAVWKYFSGLRRGDEFDSMGGTEAFPDLGKHCSEELCHQLDFLPFKCDACSKIFCLEHRSYKSHNCSKATVKDSTVLICPICAATVKTVFGEDPNLTMEKHSQTSNCDPNNYAKVMKKPKCPVKGCHELLTFSNKMTCKSCNKATCVRHRFPADHACVIKSGTVAARDLKQPARTFAGSKFLEFLAGRNGSECGTSSTQVGSSLRNSDKQIDKEKIPTIKP
jgi:predicted nucleic acid binding AN1-type Zn finger protein